MHQLLDDYLCKKYPKIFIERNKSPMETCMCWGIDTGDGWFYLIDSLCSFIQWRIDNPPYDENGKQKISQVICHQLKEKFGTLRFYYSGGNNEIRGAINFAEYISGFICEYCGKMDCSVGQTKGWIMTCCKKHSKNGKWKNINDKKLQNIWKKIEKENKKL